MPQSASGVHEGRGTAPVWKRALTGSLHTLSGLLHNHYQSSFEPRAGAKPKPKPGRSLWSSFTSGVASVGHFVASAPGRVAQGAVAFVKDPVGTLVKGAKQLGSFVVSGVKAAFHAAVSLGKGIVWAAKSVFDFVVKAVTTIWNAVFKFVQHLFAQFSQHENKVDQQIAQQNRQAQKQYEKLHAQQVYDEHQLAKTVESAKQSAQQEVQLAQEAKAAIRKVR